MKTGYYSMATQIYNKGHHSAGPSRRSESRLKQKSLRIPLENAIDDLDIILEEAINFYTQFKNDYEQEIAGIRSYATSDVLGHLWTSKVQESDSSRSAPRTHNENTRGTHSETEEKMPRCGFRIMAKRVCRSFEAAIVAANNLVAHRSSLDGRPDLQAIAWILKKLKGAYNDIHNRFGSASRRASQIDDLSTEMKMALTFLKADQAKRDEGSGFSEPAIQSSAGFVKGDEDGPEILTGEDGIFIPYLYTND